MNDLPLPDTPAEPAGASGVPDRSGTDDPRVVAALEEYLAACERGTPPDRVHFLTRHAEVATELAGLLDGLQFIQAAVSGLRSEPSHGVANVQNLGRTLGDFRILHELGRGGMGVVYAAEQMSLRRRVALKVLPMVAALDERHLQRFKNEAQAAAYLHHQHIVPVYSVGCERGIHYYAMQYIDGHSLAWLLDERRRQVAREPTDHPGSRTPPPGAGKSVAEGEAELTEEFLPNTTEADKPFPRSAVDTVRSSLQMKSTAHSDDHSAWIRRVVQLTIQAAEALEYAHQQGVIHRDIKPANLLLDVRGDVWVTDFGLAHIQSETHLTLTGDLIGTLRYMSPEQAMGKRVPIDHRTDVYSLGATLYELLTLQPATAGQDRAEILRRLAFEEPVPPRRCNRELSVELEIILLKALTKDPTERYSTAQEFADDLKCVLEDRPIRARRPTIAQHARRWARRHQTMVQVVMACCSLAVAGVIAVLAWSNAQIRAAKRETEFQAQAATAAFAREQTLRVQERRTSYRHSVALALRESDAGNPAAAVELLQQAPAEHRNWEWHHLSRLLRSDLRRIELPQAAAPDKVPLLLSLAGNGHTLVAVTAHKRLLLRDLWSGEEWSSYAFPTHPERLAVSSDGITVAYSCRESPEGTTDDVAGVVYLADARSPAAAQRLFARPRMVSELAFHPNGRLLAVGHADGVVQLWQVPQGEVLQTLSAPRQAVRELKFNSDGSYLATLSRPDGVRIWGTHSGKLLRRLSLGGVEAASLTWHGQGTTLAIGMADGRVTLWDTVTGVEKLTFRAGTGWIKGVACSPDGQTIATSLLDDHHIYLWDANTGNRRGFLGGHTSPPLHLDYSSSGMFLLSAAGHAVHLWDTTGLEQGEIPVQALAAAINQNGSRVAVLQPAAESGLVTKTRFVVGVWDTTTRQNLVSFDDFQLSPTVVEEFPTARLSFPARANEVLLSDMDSYRVRWDVHQHRRISEHRDPEKQKQFTVFASAHSPLPGRRGEVRPLPKLPENTFFTVSRNGARVAERWSKSDSLRVFNVDDNRLVFSAKPEEGNWSALVLSDDGSQLALASDRGSKLTVWKIDENKVVLDYLLAARPKSVRFQPGGQRIACLSESNSLEVVNLDRGQREYYREWPGVDAECLDFSPDGKRLIVGVDRHFGREGGLLICDSQNWQDIVTLPAPFPVRRAQFSGDGRFLLISDARRRMRVLSGVAGKEESDLNRLQKNEGAWHKVELVNCLEAGNESGVAWHLERLVADDLPNRRLYLQRCLLRQKKNDFAGAAQDLEKLLALGFQPEPNSEGFELAWGAVRSGRPELYARFCERLRAQRSGVPATAALLARMYTLGPGALPEMAPVLEHAEAALQAEPNRTAYQFIAGAAFYRAGRYEEAIAKLTEATSRQPQWEGHGNSWLLLALAAHARGQTAESRRYQELAEDWIREHAGEASDANPIIPHVTAHTYLTLDLLRREAHRILSPLSGAPPVPD